MKRTLHGKMKFLLILTVVTAAFSTPVSQENCYRLQLSKSHVRIFLYTRTDVNGFEVDLSNSTSISETSFDVNKESVFFAHGWVNSYQSPACVEVRDAFLKTADVNVFIVDWSEIASLEYGPAQQQVSIIGNLLGKDIVSFAASSGLDLNKTSMVGHSLGAHLVGVAGKVLGGKLKTIIGLDPAFPMYSISRTDNRLNKGDAKFVQVIHTCAGVFGFDVALGDADYWPNGGRFQPGCESDFSGACNHGRSFEFFSESLISGNFYSYKCNSYADFKDENCPGVSSYLGEFDLDTRVEAIPQPLEADGEAQLLELIIKDTDIKIYFYNSQNLSKGIKVNLSDSTAIHESTFDSTKQTHFVVHGYLNNYSSESCQSIKDALLKKIDCNVFIVDWSKYSLRFYTTAFRAVEPVGKILGDLIRQMVENNDLRLEKISLTGHSLGAHVAGVAGTLLGGQVDYIIGLDPAGPLFSYKKTTNRLNPSSAKFVQVIHTSNIYGMFNPIGHADYYPNGGKEQPGCNVILKGQCSHHRAFQYYSESLLTGNFKSHSCDNYDNFTNKKCNKNFISMMGQCNIDKNATGTYFLETNPISPFAEN
ncbi:uncharacterized protein [Leptinotarsa decemlineata]|uniref:uncharacterized protein n=1 Tax=Leptinotarsa decemlineata TaxID=7539 RepID=UPI003D3050BC